MLADPLTTRNDWIQMDSLNAFLMSLNSSVDSFAAGPTAWWIMIGLLGLFVVLPLLMSPLFHARFKTNGVSTKNTMAFVLCYGFTITFSLFVTYHTVFLDAFTGFPERVSYAAVVVVQSLSFAAFLNVMSRVLLNRAREPYPKSVFHRKSFQQATSISVSHEPLVVREPKSSIGYTQAKSPEYLELTPSGPVAIPNFPDMTVSVVTTGSIPVIPDSSQLESRPTLASHQ